jgi:hypothetical protein
VAFASVVRLLKEHLREELARENENRLQERLQERLALASMRLREQVTRDVEERLRRDFAPQFAEHDERITRLDHNAARRTGRDAERSKPLSAMGVIHERRQLMQLQQMTALAEHDLNS